MWWSSPSGGRGPPRRRDRRRLVRRSFGRRGAGDARRGPARSGGVLRDRVVPCGGRPADRRRPGARRRCFPDAPECGAAVGLPTGCRRPGIEPAALEPEPGVEFAVVVLRRGHRRGRQTVGPGGAPGRPVAGTGPSSEGSWPGSPTSAGWWRPGTAKPIDPASCTGSIEGPRACSSSRRTPRAFRSLGEQMAEHTAERRYAALVHGHVAEDRGLVDAPVGRSSRQPTLMTVSSAGADAGPLPRSWPATTIRSRRRWWWPPSRRAGPTRSGSTWPRSAIRSWVTPAMEGPDVEPPRGARPGAVLPSCVRVGVRPPSRWPSGHVPGTAARGPRRAPGRRARTGLSRCLGGAVRPDYVLVVQQRGQPVFLGPSDPSDSDP